MIKVVIKSLPIALFAIMILSGCQSQKIGTAFANDDIHYVGNVKMTVYHNPHDLENISKTSLKHIYKKRLRLYLEMLPYLAVKCKPGQDIRTLSGVPMTKKRIKDAQKQEEIKNEYLDGLDANLDKVINFADTRDIINAIVFLDIQIGQMRNFLGLEDQ